MTNVLNKDDHGGGDIVSGQSNTPLTALGIEQAKSIAKTPIIQTVTQVFSSDLDRAYDTAYHIFGDSKIINKSHLLRERTLGIFDGRNMDQMRKVDFLRKYFEDPKLKDFRLSFTTRAPGGENLHDVCERVEEFLESYNEMLNGNVNALVTHGAFMKCFLKVVTGISEKETMEMKISNCQVIVLDQIDDLKFKVVQI